MQHVGSMRMRKTTTLFFLMGTAYMATEVVYNALVPFKLSLIGSSSIWMGAVGGALGVLLGGLSPGGKLMPANSFYAARVIAGGLAINTVELLSGLVLNLMLGLDIWDYSDSFLNIAGQVCAYHAVMWFLFTPFVFWLDDVMRFYLYDGARPVPMIRYYTMALSKVRY